MTKITNVSNHSLDLDDGRVLAPGESAEVDLHKTHNQFLVDNRYVVVEDKKAIKREDDKS